MNVSDLLIGISLSQAVFIILITFSKAKRQVDDVIILVWILLLALPMMTKLFSSVQVSPPGSIVGYNLPYPLLHGPMLWLYTCSLTGKKIRLNLDTFRHAMPFILGSTLQIVTTGHNSYSNFNSAPVILPYQLVESLILVTSLVYSARVLWHMREYESMGGFSDLSAKITLKWLNWLTVAVVILPAFHHIIGLSVWAPSYGIAFAVFIFLLEYFCIRRTFRERFIPEPAPAVIGLVKNQEDQSQYDGCSEQSELTQAAERCKKEKYARSGLTSQKSCEYLERLNAYMQQERPYLDANITIEIMAQQLGISRNYLTQILNEKLETNFYSFINEYRIAAFKRLVADPANQKATLISLAYDSGFNTKSTFNTAFKKIEGITPSQYRKSVLVQRCAA